MCLDRKGTFKPCKVGYKVMLLVVDNQLVGEWQGLSKPRKLGVWLDESEFRIFDEEHLTTLRTWYSKSKYPIGWHIYNSVADAVELIGYGSKEIVPPGYTVVKVSVRNPVAVGYQGMFNRRITVAKQIKILKVLSSDECQDIARKAAA